MCAPSAKGAEGNNYLGSLCALDRGEDAPLTHRSQRRGGWGSRHLDARYRRSSLAVRIYDRENSDYVVVSGVDEKKRRCDGAWIRPATVRRRRGLMPTCVEVIRVRGLRLDARSPRVFHQPADEPPSRYYAPRVINDQSPHSPPTTWRRPARRTACPWS